MKLLLGRVKELVARFAEGVKLAFTIDPIAPILDSFKADVYPPRRRRKQYLTNAERETIMLTADGSVYLGMGAVCTEEEIRNTKRELRIYARRYLKKVNQENVV